MDQDPTLICGTYDTTGVNPGVHSDVTQVTAVNFKEVGSNPGGIADWERYHELHQEILRKQHRVRKSLEVDLATKLANLAESKGE
jgi:hypothetical protein